MLFIKNGLCEGRWSAKLNIKYKISWKQQKKNFKEVGEDELSEQLQQFYILIENDSINKLKTEFKELRSQK